jgi:Zn-dependent protease with chaperone function
MLWARVRQLAAQVGTRAPRRIYLVPKVNAAVWENPRLLGLIPGPRQMMIGVPLLVALTPAQLDSVLCHELGHYGNSDTRLGGLVGRARVSVLAALDAAGRPRRVKLPGSGLFVLLFCSYARVVLRFTQPASRAQELAADRVAARVAGTASTIAALRELPGLDAAFDFYLNRYIAPGLALGLMPPPPEVFGGFAALLAEPSRRAELDEMRQHPREEEANPFDSHPPIAERVAALMALPPDGSTLDTSGVRAVAILANPAHALTSVAVQALQKPAAGAQIVPWDTVADATGLHRADEAAKPLREAVTGLTGRPAELPTFIDLIKSGRLGEVLAALPRSESSRRTDATGRVAVEHAKTVLAPALTGWLTGHLARSRLAGWAHSWSHVGGDLRMAPELQAALDAAVDDLVAVRPDHARLRALVSDLVVTA